MAARATRSASRGSASSNSDDGSRCLLLALSHDELGVIFDGLADPLQPVVAIALSSTCLGLRTPLEPALEVLKERHDRAVALCRKAETSCAQLRDAEGLLWFNERLTADDMATLAMILLTNGLPRLRELDLSGNFLGDAGVQALCEGLGRGTAPSLSNLKLQENRFGPAGAEALAATLRRGAMPKLDLLDIGINPSIGNQGVAALAAPLRKLPALRIMQLGYCGIGDEGVASLVDNLGKDDFKALEMLLLHGSKIGDVGAAKIVAALDAGGLPKLIGCPLSNDPASTRAVQAVENALAKRSQ